MTSVAQSSRKDSHNLPLPYSNAEPATATTKFATLTFMSTAKVGIELGPYGPYGVGVQYATD